MTCKHKNKTKYWTEDQIKLLIEKYPDSNQEQLIKLFNNKFSYNEIRNKVNFLSNKVNLRKSKDYKCDRVSSKRKRNKGDTRIGDRGNVYIKTSDDPQSWKPLHREVWKECHGSYPSKKEILIFKDGNRKNCNIGNLECVNRKEFLSSYSVNNYPDELKQVMRLKATITRKINDKQKRHNSAT